MLVHFGGLAASPFRLTRLRLSLGSALPDSAQLTARHVHFADLARALTEAEQSQLDALLSYGDAFDQTSLSGPKWYVLPRFGTISPWSSKATDILHNAGVGAVNRVERGIEYQIDAALDADSENRLVEAIHDRMTQTVVSDIDAANQLFAEAEPQALNRIPLLENGADALNAANETLGLALSNDEIDYLYSHYQSLGRDPSDVELMMFAQANSEHCRHKIFNASWTVDGVRANTSLFEMIRSSYRASPDNILTAYSDNAAVIAGFEGERFLREADGHYRGTREPIPIQIKVETHNHPTAISPFPGAATGAGGEIRDEGATGRGGRPKGGLCGFSVSNLRVPGFEQPWELDSGKPDRIVSALNIMIEGPIGAATFNNEFGRPNLCGYFRTLETADPADEHLLRGYHKPIMIAGGLGNMREQHVAKQAFESGAKLIVLGGPAMLIGLGGGAASSMSSGSSSESLDFASVQRDNAEMERRCQEVIEQCIALGENNPLISIHDVGAGGLSNALPELINDAGRGGRIELREVPNAERGMSPMQIWCNEAQERYVLAIAPEHLRTFTELCERERCPFAVVGEATEEKDLRVTDKLLGDPPVDLPLDMLLGKPPLMHRDAVVPNRRTPSPAGNVDLPVAIERVLQLPAVASKSFLITIGDRTVGGQVVRDQMVGPWQVPVADCAVTANDYVGDAGEVMAMGERTPLALLDAPASGRMAVGEAITNLLGADVRELGDVKLSANWMAACGDQNEDGALFATVKAVAEELCPSLGIAIPVGKDSLSMRTVWDEKEMRAPLSLIVSAFAPVYDVGQSLTPQLQRDTDSTLLLIDLGCGRNRLGGSSLQQVQDEFGGEVPDLDRPELLTGLFRALRELRDDNLAMAYHDRADGGLLVTLLEMAFAGRCGLQVSVPQDVDALDFLFNEELGCVIQIADSSREQVSEILQRAGLAECTLEVASVTDDQRISVIQGQTQLYANDRAGLQGLWAQTSYRIQALRDNPDCASEELASIDDDTDPGLSPIVAFDANDDVAAPYISALPRIAILREQGVNGHVEMAAAFDRAGFDAYDVHMSDILAGRRTLHEFQGLAACGGFSYGDVLGAGGGWARTILYNAAARDQFSEFFGREDTFALGVCNGCQMMSHLKELIPGAEHWPRFLRNRSEQFEARLSLVEITPSPSIVLQGMEGSRLPVAVAHGEGRAEFSTDSTRANVAMRFVDSLGAVAERYPANPNGSPDGITGLTTSDGRITIMMPHPERLFRRHQFSWCPSDWRTSPWLRMFRNARAWLR